MDAAVHMTTVIYKFARSIMAVTNVGTEERNANAKTNTDADTYLD